MKPIVLRAHEVRGLLEGRISLLHRPIKPQPEPCFFGNTQAPPLQSGWDWKHCPSGSITSADEHFARDAAHYCPFGKPGDLLWGREAFSFVHSQVEGVGSYPIRLEIKYASDDKREYRYECDHGADFSKYKLRAYSSTQMPLWASRITLEIKEVRVYRVQSITEEESEVSGIERVGGSGWNSAMWRNYMGSGAYHVARNSFASLWESTEGWDSLNRNDWVWALSVALSTGEQKQ